MRSVVFGWTVLRDPVVYRDELFEQPDIEGVGVGRDVVSRDAPRLDDDWLVARWTVQNRSD